MSKFKTEAFEPLDEEEKVLIDALESETWQTVTNIEEEVEKAVMAACATAANRKMPARPLIASR